MAFLRFNHWLSELAESSGPISAVFFEEVRAHAGTLAAHVYGGFLAHLEAWAEFRDVPYQGVPVGTIKRFIAGKGNADKRAVIAAVMERLLDDACVALSLLLQHGVSPDALASSMGRLGDGASPASIIGALADLIACESRRQ